MEIYLLETLISVPLCCCRWPRKLRWCHCCKYSYLNSVGKKGSYILQ